MAKVNFIISIFLLFNLSQRGSTMLLEQAFPDELVMNNKLTANDYCSIVQELYVESEWYMKVMNKMEKDSNIWI